MSIVSLVVYASSFVVLSATLSVLIWHVSVDCFLFVSVLSTIILSAVTVYDASCVLLVVHCVCC